MSFRSSSFESENNYESLFNEYNSLNDSQKDPIFDYQSDENNLNKEQTLTDVAKEANDFEPFKNSFNTHGLNQVQDDEINNEIIFLNENIVSTNTNSNHEKKNKASIFEISKDKKKFEQKYTKKAETQFLNKKRKNSESKPKHTKYDFDNISRKIRSHLFDSIKNILNIALEEDEENNINNNNINNKPFVKKQKKIISGIQYKRGNLGFLKINSEISQLTNVEKNKQLLNRTLRNIFSEKNSSKPGEEDYNEKLIQKITLEQGKVKTNKILDCTFLECLNHFRKKRFNPQAEDFVFKPELQKLEDEYDRLINELKLKDENYAEAFKKSLDNYDKFTNQKKSRQKRKREEKKEIEKNNIIN